MRSASLTRMDTSDQGTFGRLVTDSGLVVFSGELPWRENLPEVSCIPAGLYLCTWRQSTRHGDCYHVEGVPGRAGVEIHAANFMGDRTKGLRCELLGCIAPGTSVGTLTGQRALVASRQALLALEGELEREPFELTIAWAPAAR